MSLIPAFNFPSLSAFIQVTPSTTVKVSSLNSGRDVGLAGTHVMDEKHLKSPVLNVFLKVKLSHLFH